MPFCSKCGTSNQDDASACSSCGNNLKSTPNIFSSGGDGFIGKNKGYISKLMQFFDSGEFFKLSWKGFFYDLPAILYALIPVGLIVAAIKVKIFDMPAKMAIVIFIAFIFITVASALSFLAMRGRTKGFDEATKDFSASKVTLANFYGFFKVACVHSVETLTYAAGIFIAIAVFGLAFCGLFAEEIREMFGWYIIFGFIAGPMYAYANIFITKVLVLFLKVFLEYLPKLFIMPIRALYNLFGIIIDTRQNLWK